MRTGIALGSNLGDRHALLDSAVASLRLLHEHGSFLTSSYYETDPHDCPQDSPAFLNAVVELDTSLSPLILLKKLQELEAQAGRAKVRAFHAPRSLDLDILYWGDLSLLTGELQLPHPRIRERLFVLQPLAEIRPHLKLPGNLLTCLEMLLLVSNKLNQAITV